MAQFDTLIRGGRIVDGSGAPSLVADIAIKDGKVVAVGKALGQATRTLDADGLIAPGRRADINLFDLKRLHAAAPRTTYDLPADMPRLSQRVEGYVATLVHGEVVQEGGVLTGARPGRVLRGGVAAKA